MATRKIRRDRKESSGARVEVNDLDGKSVSDDLECVEPEPESRDASDAGNTFDPNASDASEPASGDESGEPRKRRKYTKRANKKESPSNLTEILLRSHFMLATLLDTEELLLNDGEAENLAEAINRVEALYSKSWLSEEASAWIGLSMVLATIYGPRWMAIRKRQASNKPIEVVPINRTATG